MIALLTPLLVSRLCTRRWTKMDIRPNIKPNSHIFGYIVNGIRLGEALWIFEHST